MFDDINERIKKICVHLKDENNPLQTILMKEPDFTLPLFYALCNVLNENTICDIAEGLSELYEPAKDILPQEIPKESSKLTFNTILYCALHVDLLDSGERVYLKNIGKCWEPKFKSTATVEQMRFHLKSIQSMCFPILEGSIQLYAWHEKSKCWENIWNNNEDFWRFHFKDIFYKLHHVDSLLHIPFPLLEELTTKSNWIKPLVKAELTKRKTRKFVKGNKMPDSKEFKKMYGENVPEYYFFNDILLGLDWSDDETEDPNMFWEINERIKRECAHLRDEENPLKTILMAEPSLTLPLFYALCNVMEARYISDIIEGLVELHEPVKHVLPKEIPKESRHLTFNTILYCAFHANPLTMGKNTYMENIGKGWGPIFESTMNIEQMRNHVKHVEERVFPIEKYGSTLYAWIEDLETWLPVRAHDEEYVENRFIRVYLAISWFDSFQKIPLPLQIEIFFNKDWLEPLIKEKIKKMATTEMEGNNLPEGDFKKVYGRNVPEYYFFARSNR